MTDFGENQPYIVNLLLKQKILKPEILEKAKHFADKNSVGVVDALVAESLLTEEQILKPLAEDLGMDFLKLSNAKIDSKAIEKLTYQQAREYHIMPVRLDFETLVVATHKPLDLVHLDNLRLLLNLHIDTVVASSSEIQQAIENCYRGPEAISEEVSKKEMTDDEMGGLLIDYLDKDEKKQLDAEDAPVIRLVSSVIMKALQLHASDIHLEPMENAFRIRYRIDGVLIEIKSHPKQLQAPVLSRVKLLADMKLSERRLPQDGKIKLNIRNRQIDIRVSSLPSTYGESVVMRILDKSELSLGLARLGFLSDTEKIWRQLIAASNGVILITGPTGSGKTTTLYSCLNALNTPGRKIITVEDPIEYQLSGINQVQVREDIHLTFSRVLRACLRQAPNIIMVGEIRDSETARIAMNAAFTGHLVFSTLHTNDASGGVTRLIDQGIEPFLVASAVRGILAQRLVRNICPECRTHYRPSDEELETLGIRKSEKTPTLFRGQGCVNCNGTGYKGRSGIFELLQLTPDVQELVYQKKSSSEIRDLAIRNGMRTLREDAVVKVLNGTTTMEELLRVTKIGET